MTPVKKAPTGAKNKRKKPSEKIVKQPKLIKTDARLRQKPKYKSFRMHKRVKHHEPPIIGAFSISRKSFKLMMKNKINIALFAVIYGALFLLLVRGIFNPINIGDLRFEIESATGEGTGSSFSSNTLIFNKLVGSLAAGLSGNQGVYQLVLFVVGALSVIWLFRQQQAGNKVNVKQAFYRGMYPLVPFTLVIYVIVLQLLPAIIGNFLYSTVISNGIATGQVEQFVWLLLYLSTLLLSFYLISSSVIALMIVTLPEMTPLRALRKAKELVTFRRFSVFRKTTMLLLIVAALFALIVFPALFISAQLAQILFLVLSVLSLPFAVGYIFVLYRELL
jgi:hypothetical protein